MEVRGEGLLNDPFCREWGVDELMKKRGSAGRVVQGAHLAGPRLPLPHIREVVWVSVGQYESHRDWAHCSL